MKVQEGIRLGQGERDRDWKTMKKEAPSHWMAGPLRWKVAVAAAAVVVVAAAPAVAEDIAAAAER